MQADRLYQLKDLLEARPGISMAELESGLEASRATVKRGIEALRDRFDMPIEYDRFERGYFVRRRPDPKTPGRTPKSAELPGLWFSPEEAQALLTIQQLLSTLEPSLLESRLKPLRAKLDRLLASGGYRLDQVQQRVKVVHAGKRRLNLTCFEQVAAATLARKRIVIDHTGHESGKALKREVSPQQLVHYRDNWYLDAWCHVREGLRSFAVDAINEVTPLETPAQEIPSEQIVATLGGGYGIFGGKPKAVARLKFTPERARWVAKEQWHPDQRSGFDADGSYWLEVPYSDERELVGDILRHGEGVVVTGPAELRARVQQGLLWASMRYVG